jgi:hypothetical protein
MARWRRSRREYNNIFYENFRNFQMSDVLGLGGGNTVDPHNVGVAAGPSGLTFTGTRDGYGVTALAASSGQLPTGAKFTQDVRSLDPSTVLIGVGLDLSATVDRPLVVDSVGASLSSLVISGGRYPYSGDVSLGGGSAVQATTSLTVTGQFEVTGS